MRFKISILLFLCASFYTVELHSQEKEPIRVLFVGNSFMFFNNLPQVVNAMAESQGVTIETRHSTVSGSNLEQHWKEEKGTETRKLLNDQKWDYVVFNNHSLSAIETPESFETYGKKFAELVKEKGAKPVFMITWGYKSNPRLFKPINEAYIKLAEETDSQIVPAGSLMAQAREWRPNLDLYFDDKHPTSIGTYMIGLAFYKFFTGKSTLQIPERTTTTDKNGQRLYLLILSKENAEFLKMLVEDFEFEIASE
ncbi:DUF4886 domain-containing protein [Fulvivirga lutea]|uniref:DUF4886 domain-containing protein n=1 Tax=Fulvivirga lutea TaxID=2810512 RepID=A0A974WHP8_9BACT|nr:DUF4886 domain-containing protein [Fulvivirga lutea]QSE98759.1 hypothetical protein JR347_06675 [Fulvivirga lutea]